MTKRNPKTKRKKSTKRYLDCVAMKRRIQAKIYAEIKDMTREQELEYWRKGAERGPWGDWWRKIHERSAAKRQRHRRRSGWTEALPALVGR